MSADLPQDDQLDQSASADQAESGNESGAEEQEEQSIVREKTPDTNVKLNQPLRCGRYGQDLISHKQRNADKAQSQVPRLGGGRKVDPALIASRQSTSAAPVVFKAAQARGPIPKPKGADTSLLPPAVPTALQHAALGPLDRAVSQQPAQAASGTGRPSAATGAPAPPGPPPASVDQLLTGPVPRGSVMTASMAGAAAAMAESAAAIAGSTASDREAVKAALGHHYRQYRAKKAVAEERAKAASQMVGKAGAAATDMPVSTASGTVRMSHQQPGAGLQPGGDLISHQPVSVSAPAGDNDDIPLRVKYATSSSGSSSQATSSLSRDTQSTSSSRQQPLMQQQHAQHRHTRPELHSQVSRDCAKPQQKQPLVPQQPGKIVTQVSQQAPSRILYRHSSSAQNQIGAQHAQQDRQTQGPLVKLAVQSAAPEDVELQLADAGSESEADVRKSNDRLDALLQSTVKRTHQMVPGKENKVSTDQNANLHITLFCS